LDEDNRKARNRWIWSGGLLLAGLLLFGATVVWSDFLLGQTEFGRDVLAFAILCVVASALTAGAAVVAQSRALQDQGKRRVLLWSSWFLAFALATLVISLGFAPLFASPGCQGPAGGDYCAFVIGFPLLFTWAVLGIPTLIAYGGAVIVGLSTAARFKQRGWFVAILLYLIASIVSVVVAVRVLVPLVPDDPNLAVLPQVIVVVLSVSPVLVPVLTLVYSLAGRSRARVSDTTQPVG
jgi:hypothetical protein